MTIMDPGGPYTEMTPDYRETVEKLRTKLREAETEARESNARVGVLESRLSAQADELATLRALVEAVIDDGSPRYDDGCCRYCSSNAFGKAHYADCAWVLLDQAICKSASQEPTA